MKTEKLDKFSFVPLYRQLKKIIKTQIETNQKKPGDSIPSEKELCELYGISQITARKAIFELVNEGMLFRVPGKGTFIVEPKPGAKSPLKTKTENIGFIISQEHHPVFSNSFYSLVFNGAEEESRSQGYNLFYQTVDENSMSDLMSFKLIKEKKVDGLLLVGEMNHDFILKLREKEIPLVLVDHWIQGIDLDAIVTDNVNSAFEAVNYLIDLGHRTIGFVSASFQYETFNERFKGYKLALQKHNLEYNENFLQINVPWSGYGVMDKILARKVFPTAIFACNDLIAIRIMTAIQDRNLKIPDDISVIGFDDIDLSSQIYPALTTLRVHKEEMGSLAVKRLIQGINDKERVPKKTVLPTELVTRKSCKKFRKKKR